MHLAVVYTEVPASLSITPGIPRQFFSFVSAYAVASDLTIAIAAAAKDYATATKLGAAAVLQSHQQAWTGLYSPYTSSSERGDATDDETGSAGGLISCEGNLELSQALWSAQHSILSSVRADHVNHGLSPGGLATGGCNEAHANWTACSYLGHVFWDLESFILVPLIFLHPASLARTALDYRKSTLPAAFNKYQLLQKREPHPLQKKEPRRRHDEIDAEMGPAWFAWESGGTGADQLLVTNIDDPYAVLEVSADALLSCGTAPSAGIFFSP
jgi:hypothetical protein